MQYNCSRKTFQVAWVCAIVLHFPTHRSERQKKLLRRDTGVTERGGQFDELKTFKAIE